MIYDNTDEPKLSNPLVSIIMPMYNSAQFVSQSIDSVIEQSYEKWELLISDDGSKDDSLHIAQKYAEKDFRIKILPSQDKNQGSTQARNRATEQANGEYIAFLDSDDLWHRTKLEKQIQFMQKSLTAWSFTNYYRIDEQDRLLTESTCPFDKVDWNILIRTNPVGMLSAMYSTKELGKHYFVNNDVNREDYLLWLGVARNGAVAYLLPETLASYRVRKKSVSSNKLSMVIHQYRTLKQLRIPLIKRIYFIIQYVYFAVNKRKNHTLM